VADSLPSPSPKAQIVLDYDRTEFRFPGVYMMSFKAWPIKMTPGIPHGVRYAFNLFAPDAQGTPNNPILRFDNEHAPSAVKHPYDHWHPPRRGPGGWPIGEGDDQPLTADLADLPVIFLEKSYALLEEMGVDISGGIKTVAPSRVVGIDKGPSPVKPSAAKAKIRRKK